MTANEIIVASNLFFMLSALYGAYTTARWYIRDMLTVGAERVVIAWIWIFIAIAANVGWFYVSRVTAPEDMIWNPWMFEWRWVIIATTAMAFGFGMYKFESVIEPSKANIHRVAFIVVLVGCLIAGKLWN